MFVIESDEYRREVEVLKTDPIILGMNVSLGALAVPDLESWAFTSAASREYHARGGKNAHSLGGPARAIRALRDA